MHGRAHVALAVCLAGAWLAPAARGDGTVSRGAPALVWKGSASGSPVLWADIALAAEGQPILCPPAFCDAYTVQVADSADLGIESSSCEDDVTAVEVERPDGSRLFADGLEGSPRTIVDIAQAPVGAYVVRTLVNRAPLEGGAYIGHATLAFPLPRVVLKAASRTLTTAHARHSRSVWFALSASGPITTVRGVLRRNGAVVASGRLAALDGQGRLSLAFSRALRAGVYRLTVTADDDSGQVVAKARLRIARKRSRARAAASVRAPESPPQAPAAALCR
jgi:hypothetical protein